MTNVIYSAAAILARHPAVEGRAANGDEPAGNGDIAVSVDIAPIHVPTPTPTPTADPTCLDPASCSDGLAATGGDPTLLIVVGIVLLVLGAAVLLARWARRGDAAHG